MNPSEEKPTMMDPAEIGRRLIALAADVELAEILVGNLNLTVDQEEALQHEFGVNERYRRPAKAMIEELREALAESHWEPDLSEIPQDERNRWSFGEAIVFRGLEREIHHGFLAPRRKAPLLRGVHDEVALFLITLDEGEDYLKRENHGMGWHYHYLDWRKQRSNVILSWDTRWLQPTSPTKTSMLRALFVEPHGEKRNADFQAKPWLWGDKKRQSMYEACSPDLARWPIGEFKCAADKSEIVYPPGRTLTPHPAAVAAIQKAVVAAKATKKRPR